MNEEIQRYIRDSRELISCQAQMIEKLSSELSAVKAEKAELSKIAEDNTLDDIIDCLKKDQWTQESITKALENKDVDCLEKKAEELEDDSFGELDDSQPTVSCNIRPSEKRLYARLGLI